MKILENTKAIILADPPALFHDSSLTSPIISLLPPDSEIEIGDQVGAAVQVILPDSTVGYIDGNEELNAITASWFHTETEIYSEPNKSSKPTVFQKGEEFELLNSVPGTNDKWLRIRSHSGEIGFLPGDVEIVTTDSLMEFVGEQIGNETSEQKIVRKISDLGVPAEQAQGIYTELAQAITVYEASPEGQQDMANAYSRKMLFGVLWVVGGIIATVVSMDAASDGGIYYVFWGAVVFGAFDIIRGLFGYLKYAN